MRYDRSCLVVAVEALVMKYDHEPMTVDLYLLLGEEEVEEHPTLYSVYLAEEVADLGVVLVVEMVVWKLDFLKEEEEVAYFLGAPYCPLKEVVVYLSQVEVVEERIQLAHYLNLLL